MTQLTLLVASPIADDHAFLRQVFDGNGWNVLSAGSSEEAADLAERHNVAAVIAEQRLEDTSWKAMWERMQAAGVRPVLIVASRHADNRLWGEVLNPGGWDVLPKPLERSEVERVVSAELRWRDSLAALEKA